MGVATAGTVDDARAPAVTCLWELSDGTKGCAIQDAQGWEFHVQRRGRVLRRDRCRSLDDLIAAATAAHRDHSLAS